MTHPRAADAPVDWNALRRRLDEAHAGLSMPDDAETTRRILAQRALRLAEPDARAKESGTTDLIRFTLGRESCALEASVVFSVFRLAGFARLPGAPARIHGVTLWRGEIMTVLDLRPLLGVTTAGLTDLSRVIAVGRNRVAFGFLADSVTGVRKTRPAEIHPPSGQASSNQSLVRGITSDAMLVIDTGQLLRLANQELR